MHTCYLEDVDDMRVMALFKPEYLSVVDVILLKHVHIKPQDPNIENKDSYPSPGGKIPRKLRLVRNR